jgi:hypothetical protein
LTTGFRLSTATIEQSAQTATLRGFGCGRAVESSANLARNRAGQSRRNAASSKQATAIVMLSQLSHERLPLTMSRS